MSLCYAIRFRNIIVSALYIKRLNLRINVRGSIRDDTPICTVEQLSVQFYN